MKKIFLLFALCAAVNCYAQDDNTKSTTEQTTEQSSEQTTEQTKSPEHPSRMTREEIEKSGQGGYNPGQGMGYAGQRTGKNK